MGGILNLMGIPNAHFLCALYLRADLNLVRRYLFSRNRPLYARLRKKKTFSNKGSLTTFDIWVLRVFLTQVDRAPYVRRKIRFLNKE